MKLCEKKALGRARLAYLSEIAIWDIIYFLSLTTCERIFLGSKKYALTSCQGEKIYDVPNCNLTEICKPGSTQSFLFTELHDVMQSHLPQVSREQQQRWHEEWLREEQQERRKEQRRQMEQRRREEQQEQEPQCRQLQQGEQLRQQQHEGQQHHQQEQRRQ